MDQQRSTTSTAAPRPPMKLPAPKLIQASINSTEGTTAAGSVESIPPLAPSSSSDSLPLTPPLTLRSSSSQTSTEQPAAAISPSSKSSQSAVTLHLSLDSSFTHFAPLTPPAATAAATVQPLQPSQTNVAQAPSPSSTSNAAVSASVSPTHSFKKSLLEIDESEKGLLDEFREQLKQFQKAYKDDTLKERCVQCVRYMRLILEHPQALTELEQTAHADFATLLCIADSKRFSYLTVETRLHTLELILELAFVMYHYTGCNGRPDFAKEQLQQLKNIEDDVSSSNSARNAYVGIRQRCKFAVSVSYAVLKLIFDCEKNKEPDWAKHAVNVARTAVSFLASFAQIQMESGAAELKDAFIEFLKLQAQEWLSKGMLKPLLVMQSQADLKITKEMIEEFQRCHHGVMADRFGFNWEIQATYLRAHAVMLKRLCSTIEGSPYASLSDDDREELCLLLMNGHPKRLKNGQLDSKERYRGFLNGAKFSHWFFCNDWRVRDTLLSLAIEIVAEGAQWDNTRAAAEKRYRDQREKDNILSAKDRKKKHDLEETFRAESSSRSKNRVRATPLIRRGEAIVPLVHYPLSVVSLCCDMILSSELGESKDVVRETASQALCEQEASFDRPYVGFDLRKGMANAFMAYKDTIRERLEVSLHGHSRTRDPESRSESHRDSTTRSTSSRPSPPPPSPPHIPAPTSVHDDNASHPFLKEAAIGAAPTSAASKTISVYASSSSTSSPSSFTSLTDEDFSDLQLPRESCYEWETVSDDRSQLRARLLGLSYLLKQEVDTAEVSTLVWQVVEENGAVSEEERQAALKEHEQRVARFATPEHEANFAPVAEKLDESAAAIVPPPVETNPIADVKVDVKPQVRVPQRVTVHRSKAVDTASKEVKIVRGKKSAPQIVAAQLQSSQQQLHPSSPPTVENIVLNQPVPVASDSSSSHATVQEVVSESKESATAVVQSAPIEVELTQLLVSDPIHPVISTKHESSETQSQFSKLFDEGCAAVSEERYLQSISFFTRCLALHSAILLPAMKVQALVARGLSFAALKNFDAALRDVEAALTACPADDTRSMIEIFSRTADVFERTDQMQSAMQFYERAIKLCEELPALNSFGWTASAPVSSNEAFHVASALYCKLVSLLLPSGDWEACHIRTNRAIMLDPVNTQAWFNLGLLCSMQTIISPISDAAKYKQLLSIGLRAFKHARHLCSATPSTEEPNQETAAERDHGSELKVDGLKVERIDGPHNISSHQRPILAQVHAPLVSFAESSTRGKIDREWFRQFSVMQSRVVIAHALSFESDLKHAMIQPAFQSR